MRVARVGRSRSTVAALCGLVVLAGCGAENAADTTQAAKQAVGGFEVHETATPAPLQAAPIRRTKGCVMVRQDDAQGSKDCVPRKAVCTTGANWWTADVAKLCGPLQPVPIRIVSAPDELPVGASMCVVWAGSPGKIREGVLVVASAHANCATGLVGAVAAPPAQPLAAAFPTERPDCAKNYPGTRRAWLAKVAFVEPPSTAWACLIG
ncbi:MAG: hypothetical protein ACT4QG_21280 [Sporichthyaceae bacterium]